MTEAPESRPALLLTGHDTIECCYYLRAERGKGLDFGDLAEKREALRQSKSRDPLPVTLAGVEFLLQRYGSGSGYPLVLTNADMEIQCGEYNDPSFYVTYRSEALWREGAFGMHGRFFDWARALAPKPRPDKRLECLAERMRWRVTQVKRCQLRQRHPQRIVCQGKCLPLVKQFRERFA